MLSLMQSVFREYYGKKKVHRTNDYVYVEGSLPVALVAHADTVHAALPKEIFYDKDKNVVWSPEGIGADDRAGIFAIIDILREGLRPSVIICNEEEVGGKGAKRFVKAYPKPLSKVNFIIELDRMGEEDMVFYACDNPDFEAYLEPYGFVTDWGTFSDIATIAPKWGVAAVNLSIGYMDEHTKSERLYVGRMFETIQRVKSILHDELITEHPFEYIECADYYSKMWSRYSYDDEDIYDYSGVPIKHASKYARTFFRACDFCGSGMEPDDEVIVEAYGEKYHICTTCAVGVVGFCETCGRTFFPQSDEDKICFSCRRKMGK